MVDSIVRRASSESWHARVEAIGAMDMPAVRYQL
jgi:hypothetical protein